METSLALWILSVLSGQAGNAFLIQMFEGGDGDIGAF